MSTLRVQLAPGLTSLATLGVGDPGALLDADEPRLARGEELPVPEPGARRFRLPLPGTPQDDGGPLRGRPAGTGGAGTGWIVLERWRRAPLGPLLESRLTHPRSASQAERRWNLLCHLRSHGVGTPQPLAVGARGRGLVSRDSFLVTREVAEGESLPAWLARERDPAARRRGLRALGAALASLIEARVDLPALRAEDVRVLAPHGHNASSDDAGSCADAPPVGGALRFERLPGVLLTEVRGGRLRPALEPAQVARLLRRIDAQLAPAALSARERLALLALALERFPRPWRHSVWRAAAR